MELEGIEPSSKRGPNGLSTCLSSSWFSSHVRHEATKHNLISKISADARSRRSPISEFHGTTISKRLGTGQWGDVSFASSFGGELRSLTVLQTTQRERNCYLRQLMVDALDIIEFEQQNSACLLTVSTRCQSQLAP